MSVCEYETEEAKKKKKEDEGKGHRHLIAAVVRASKVKEETNVADGRKNTARESV